MTHSWVTHADHLARIEDTYIRASSITAIQPASGGRGSRVTLDTGQSYVFPATEPQEIVARLGGRP